MLFVHSAGNGPAVVLLHGFCENNTCFDKQVLLLNDRYTLVRPDLPGFGKSPLHGPASISQMAEAVVHALQNTGMAHKAIFVGHSMGGYVGLAIAKKHPEYVKGLLLLHSTALADTDDRKQKRMQSIDFITKQGVEAYVSNFIPPLFANPEAQKEVCEEALIVARTCHAEGLRNALLAMKDRSESESFISSTQIPIGFIAGKADSIIPMASILAQAALVKQGQVTILSQSGHMGMVEEPHTCADAIHRFVQKCLYFYP